MSLLSIQLRFDARLQAFAAGAVNPAHIADLQIGERVYEPQAGRPYYTGRVMAYTSGPLGIGPNAAHQEAGSYQVSVHRSRAEAETALIIASELVAHFKRGTLLPAIAGAPPQPPIHIESASEMPAIPAAGWISVPVVIRWFTGA